jgi:phosphate:Na+ symporter
VAGGFVTLVPALALMLGANVGTTVIVQLLSFDISRVAPAFVLIGVFMFRKGVASRARDLGRSFIGLGRCCWRWAICCRSSRPMRMCRACGCCWG